MEDREHNFSALSERISAQTEAYVEFSNALVKIIEQIANIRDTTKDSNIKTQELMLAFSKIQIDVVNQHNIIEKDLIIVKSCLHEQSNKINNLILDNDNFNHLLTTSMVELTRVSENVKEQINDLKKEYNNLSQSIHEHFVELDGVTEFINDLKISHHKLKMVITAISIIAMMFGTLTALQILHISWFK